ncbi:CAP domain-containing protein [Lutibacter sp.]|uniref:CAP domain-containing protein n=1 Tax=Lutibacter sp. TaxID=1925666 RepID=UPI00349FFAFF
MKSTIIKLAFVILIFTIFTSCTPEDDGIFFNEITETKITYSPIENEILNLVNEYRKEQGLTTLRKLNLISSVAKTHTSYMVEVGKVNHDNFPERHELLVHNAQATAVGENVAYGYNSSESVVKAWLNSPGHKKVIEDETFTHFGISTEKDSNGRNYFTHIFINK